MKAYYINLILGFGCACLAAEIGSKVCQQRYQEALTEALNVKQDCETATFYDCCQVLCVHAFLNLQSHFQQ